MGDFTPAVKEKKSRQAVTDKLSIISSDAIDDLITQLQSSRVDNDRLEKALSTLKTEQVAVSNLSELSDTLERVIQAVEGIKYDPIIDVKAPEAKVTVEGQDLQPILMALLDLKSGITGITLPDSMKAEQTNVFIDEKYDEYKVEYYDDDDDMPVSTTYYLKGKKVAKVEYKYNRAGNLVGAKKA